MTSHPIDPKKMAAEFIAINRQLAAADDFAAWQPHGQAMHVFLDRAKDTLQNGALTGWSQADSAILFNMLLTLVAEGTQYRLETDLARAAELNAQFFPEAAKLRQRAIALAKLYLLQPIFNPLAADIRQEIFPLLDDMDAAKAPQRYMPFRVIHVGNVAERLIGFQIRTQNAALKALIGEIYARKYLRFGTSGVRGRWGRDFTEHSAKQVVQAICEYLKNVDVPRYAAGENLSGKRIVIGYDSRLNARMVAGWAAEICLANGFSVDFANRDTPTPALIYYLTDHLDPNEVAGAINCTASHNPPEWQGIKFNPRLGYPAPTNVTDFIAARLNELQLSQRPTFNANLDQAMENGKLRGFDPLDLYIKWVMASGNGNQRISLDFERIRRYFTGKLIVVDEMHGASRGYLTRLLGEIGVRYTVIHPETDPTLPGLDYANPEEPFINPLKLAVKESGAAAGLGMDTDADRFGVVDAGGQYFRPNQILPMLVRYLGVDRGLTGRVIATQTGSPIIEPLAAKINGNEVNKPETGVIPAYINHAFYNFRVGKKESRSYQHTFMVPVGIKYIEEQRRTDRRYKGIKDENLPADWRAALLIGGEESSGLTTRGHVTDKDGVWANLLILDMIAYYGSRAQKPLGTLAEIWQETCAQEGCWLSYGGREHLGSNAGRTDVDAVLEAKEDLINEFLEAFGEGKVNTLEGMQVVYAGGVRYDIAELQLRSNGDDRHYLRVRSSGTEPINRIYVESSNPATAQLLMETALKKLDSLIAREIHRAANQWRLVEVLTTTKVKENMSAALRAALNEKGWAPADIRQKLQQMVDEPGALEGRIRRMAREWIAAL